MYAFEKSLEDEEDGRKDTTYGTIDKTQRIVQITSNLPLTKIIFTSEIYESFIKIIIDINVFTRFIY